MTTNITFPMLGVALLLSFALQAQLPGVQYIRHYPIVNYYGRRAITDIKMLKDKRLILAGIDSIQGDALQDALTKTDEAGSTHYFTRHHFVVLDSTGYIAIEIPNSYLGTDWLNYPSSTYMYGATAVQPLPDNGFLATGYGMQNTAPYVNDSICFMVVRVDARGKLVWNRCLGGSGIDRAYALTLTKDGGCIAVGTTTSGDIDVTDNHQPGSTDAWVVRLDATGSVIWKKCFGGTGMDSAKAVFATSDGGFVIAGSSTSSDGDLTGNKGGIDGWVFKIDGNGTLKWQKNLGGGDADVFNGATEAPDGSYWLSGYTLSVTAVSNSHHGQADLWVVHLDASGNQLSSQGFGGSGYDAGNSIQYTLDNTLLIGGFTSSVDGDVHDQQGGVDGWLLSLSNRGELLEQHCVGTTGDEYGMAALSPGEHSAVIAGFGKVANYYSYTQEMAFMYVFGNGNHIQGKVFLDRNGNDKWDSGEPAVDPTIIRVSHGGGTREAISSGGEYNIEADTGAFTLAVRSNNSYYNFKPSSAEIRFDTYGNTDTVNFALKPIPGIRDLQLQMYPFRSTINVATLHAATGYSIYCTNRGTDTVTNATITIIKDSNLNNVYLFPDPTSISGDTVRWVIPSFKPMDAASFIMMVEPRADILLHFGDTLTTTAAVRPADGDRTPWDDSVTVRQVTVGSFDPNAKYENYDGVMPLGEIEKGKRLNYTIYFQNTGTDTAYDIRIRDTLDSRLDPGTLEMVGASAPYQLSVEGNKLSWTLNNIKLVDSNRNEPASHGYVSYRIKPVSSLVAGDKILNTASIYFDLNLPVVTNTQETVISPDLALLPVPTPVIGGLQPDYCSGSPAQKIRISNMPDPSYHATVAVTVDGVQTAVGPDSSFSLRIDTLITGYYPIEVAFRSPVDTNVVSWIFRILPTVTPVVDLESNSNTITDLGQQVVLTAMNTAGGGDAPLYTFARDRGFTNIMRAEDASNTLNILPGTLQVGENKIFVRMKTSEFCYTSQAATDSIVVTRSAVTGLIDVDNPGQVINFTPNPFNSRINITGLSGAKTYGISLLNSNGQVIVRKKVSGQQETVLETGILSRGIYLVRIYDQKKNRLIGSAKLLGTGR